MRIYISHPIAGMTDEQKQESERQGKVFAKWALNGEAVLPREIEPWCSTIESSLLPPGFCAVPGRRIGDDPHTVQCYMRGDIAEMLTCDAVLVMPGWERSAGCRDEINVAAMCGVPIHFWSN